MRATDFDNETDARDSIARVNEPGRITGLETQSSLQIARENRDDRRRSIADGSFVSGALPIDGQPLIVVKATANLKYGGVIFPLSVSADGKTIEMGAKKSGVEVKIIANKFDRWSTDGGVKISIPIPTSGSAGVESSLFIEVDTSGKTKLGVETAARAPLNHLASTQSYFFREGLSLGLGNETRVLVGSATVESSVGLGMGAGAGYGRTEAAITRWMSQGYYFMPPLR